jgi:hypothetical protein
MDPLVVATEITNVGTTVVYLYVGYRLNQRPVPARARLASAQFTLWWWGLGASAALSGGEGILAALGGLTFPLALTIQLLLLLVDTAFLWGIVGYLIYVYTGQYQLIPLSAFYAVFYAALLYVTVASRPVGVTIRAGVPTLQNSGSADPALLAFVIAAVLVPEIGAALLYLSLIRQTRDRTQRYRILLVSASILMWFAVALAVPSTSVGWGLLKGVLQSISAVLSLFAFLPPEWIRTRLGVAALEGPEAASRQALAES